MGGPDPKEVAKMYGPHPMSRALQEGGVTPDMIVSDYKMRVELLRKILKGKKTIKDKLTLGMIRESRAEAESLVAMAGWKAPEKIKVEEEMTIILKHNVPEPKEPPEGL